MTTAAAAKRTPGGPGRTIRLGYLRTIAELRTFFRTPELAFFTFLLPVLFVVIFSTVFSGDIEGPNGAKVAFSQYFIAGMIASGVMSTTFANLAGTIAVEQHDGLLKRLSGTPLPRSSYFIGKLGVALVISAVQAVIILVLGVALFGMSLPAEPSRWVVFVAVFVLGVASCSLFGIAYTRLIPNSNSAAPIIQVPLLMLQFISGVYFEYAQIPRWLQVVACMFPLKWMAQGFRYVFLPKWVGAHDYGGEWHLERVFLVLVLWTAASAAMAVLFFRWNRGRE
ncbi:MAG: ABC transporter permease [Dehalococcoidia bacterium]|nr:ABC transporter permease [Dehalococcoidia bacterium]